MILLGGFIFTLVVLVVGAHQLRSRQRWTSSSSSPQSVVVNEKEPLLHSPNPKQQDQNENTNEDERKIVPLPDFDWKTTEPLNFRPFKPKYHITMALQNSTPCDLILFDKNHLSRIHYRQHILTLHESEVIGCLPEGEQPVRELYTYLLGEYLPVQYPGMFRIIPTPDSTSGTTTFLNLVTNSSFPLSSPPTDPLECLRIIAQTVEDDFYLLLPFPSSPTSPTPPSFPPSPPSEPAMEHKAVAFLNIHPSGFLPSTKLGLPLSRIHSPVPSYDKIGPSLERFFSRIPVDKLVKRVNWSIQMHSELYSPSGNHVHESDLDDLEEMEEFGDEDGEKARLRVELQSVFRLKKTGAVEFGFKTYLYPLADVKGEVTEGENGEKVKMGEELAKAIEGLGEGNASGMWRYKGAVRWGKAVVGWLRS